MGPGARGIILVVEDHDDTRELYFQVLTAAGYRCLTASTPSAALRQARLTRFDAVVVDLGLPRREDGLDLAHDLRALSDPPPLVAINGFPSDAESIGLFAVQLMKPVDIDSLLAAVDCVLSG